MFSDQVKPNPLFFLLRGKRTHGGLVLDRDSSINFGDNSSNGTSSAPRKKSSRRVQILHVCSTELFMDHLFSAFSAFLLTG